MNHNIYASILVMFLTIYAVRALPADTDPEGNQKSVYSVLPILCTICEPVRHDFSIHSFCNWKPDHGNYRIRGRRDPGLDRRQSVPGFPSVPVWPSTLRK